MGGKSAGGSKAPTDGEVAGCNRTALGWKGKLNCRGEKVEAERGGGERSWRRRRHFGGREAWGGEPREREERDGMRRIYSVEDALQFMQGK